jgi:hypothetical protein
MRVAARNMSDVGASTVIWDTLPSQARSTRRMPAIAALPAWKTVAP